MNYYVVSVATSDDFQLLLTVDGLLRSQNKYLYFCTKYYPTENYNFLIIKYIF